MIDNNLKIEKLSSPDLISNKLKELILNGDLKVGEKLPSESSLAEMFDVSRFTVRMAISKLNTLGIVETKNGEGTFVKKFDLEEHFENISELYMNDKMLNDVSAFRNMIEIEASKLAIENCTNDELEHLKLLCEKYKERVYYYIDKKDSLENRDELMNALTDIDLEFHSYMVKMSHNELFYIAYIAAKETLRKYMITIGKPRIENLYRENYVKTVADHEAIYQSIKDKDYKKCEKYLRDMINYNMN